MKRIGRIDWCAVWQIAFFAYMMIRGFFWVMGIDL